MENSTCPSEYSTTGLLQLTSSILIVDDDPYLREIVGGELSSEDYEVVLAKDGEQGIELIHERRFDLVLLDINLPIVNGFQVLKLIKREYRTTKVIMISGQSDMRHALESRKLGADDFIGKPYDMIELLTTIDRVMGQ